MAYDNPYESKAPSNGGGYQQRQGGGGYQQRQGGGGGGKGFQPREPLTPEQLERLRLPVTVVVTGNDRIPDVDALTIDRLVKMIEEKGVTVRCGGQSETDKVVAKAARRPEYHTPWKGFDDIEIKGFGSGFNTDECFEYAKRYYMGDFESANKFQRANHAKTARLLFGKSLRSSTQLVIIWSEDGAETAASTNSRSGIAGHVIRMASASGIPVINIKPGAESRLSTFLENINVQSQQPQQPEQSQQPAAQQSDQRQHYPAPGGYNAGSQGRNDFSDDLPL